MKCFHSLKAWNCPECPNSRDQEEPPHSSFDFNSYGCCKDQESSSDPPGEGQKFAVQTSGSLQLRKMDGQGW